MPLPYVWVARLRGLPRSTSQVSLRHRLFGTLQKFRHSKTLAFISAVRSDAPTQAYLFA